MHLVKVFKPIEWSSATFLNVKRVHLWRIYKKDSANLYLMPVPLHLLAKWWRNLRGATACEEQVKQVKFDAFMAGYRKAMEDMDALKPRKQNGNDR